MVAIQAQEPASPYISLWNRVAGFDPADLDAAFLAHDVVKATLMRMTLHVVHAADYAELHDAMQTTLRASRLEDPRFRISGLTADEALALEAALLDFAAQPRTPPELEAMLGERVADPRSVWWALRSFAPLVHAPTGGPWSFAKRAFVATPNRRRTAFRREAIGALIRRYLEGFGPATVADIAQFARIQRGRVREALALAGALVELAGPGAALFDVPDARPVPSDEAPAPPRLLPMWDSTLLAYDDRTRILPADLKPVVIRVNGDVLPTVLVDGYVAGIWRPIDGRIEVTAFRRIGADEWDALEAEARSLVGLLSERDPKAFSRHRRWWTRLPEPVAVRRLPG
ncbi:MAG TPA: winged helix DNA-binding domain-containing protein [Candidatus Limnocylindrales bacterium]|nr:winged helix DNA-binding domain-containing protein [Candidatus Limnocylindrales bacterium]